MLASELHKTFIDGGPVRNLNQAVALINNFQLHDKTDLLTIALDFVELGAFDDKILQDLVGDKPEI